MGLLAVSFAAAVIAGQPPTAAHPPMRHEDEIAAFASTMAIVRTFAENCVSVSVNEGYLEGLRQRLHVVDGDHPRFAETARQVADSLKAGLSRAPSLRVWCESLYALYGPSGTMIPNLVRRQ